MLPGSAGIFHVLKLAIFKPGDYLLRREFEPAEQDFRREVEAFIKHNWPVDSIAVSSAQRAGWRAALVAKGWSVPTWPVSAGGTGWSPTQKFIWYQACAAQDIEVDADPGVSIVGPLLLQRGTPQQQDVFLPDIRALRVRWCTGYTESQLEQAGGTTLESMSTVAHLNHAGYLLNGVKTWVIEGATADWVCCLARLESEFALFAVDLHTAGVEVVPIATLDGNADMAEVRFVDVSVPKHHLLAGPEDHGSLVQMFSAGEARTLAGSAIARAQLDIINQTVASFGSLGSLGSFGSKEEEDGVRRKCSALEVDTRGLEALELRYLDALSRNLEPPFPPSLLRLRSRELLMQLGALQVECFGYYALPYPDELLLHNEGPVGPDIAASATRKALVRQVAALYEGSAELLKDDMVRQMEIDDDSQLV